MMKIPLLVANFLIILNISYAQPELTAWIMTTGFAQYTSGGPTVTMSDSGNVQLVCYNTTDVYIQATGLAGTYIMGPWVGNPNVPAGQNYTFKLTRTPTEELGAKTAVPLFGSVAVAVNGVVFYGYGDGKSYKASTGNNEPNGDGNWFSDAWVSEGSSMDVGGNGHADMNGDYHYHASPVALYPASGTSHSPIIGFAYDGFPIYGPYGYTNPTNSSSGISRMVSGYTLRTITDRNSTIPPGPTLASQPLGTYIEDYEHLGITGDLDEYNGRFCHTPEYPTGTYAYFITINSIGDPAFPYLFAAEYYGEVDNTSTNNSMPMGLNCGTTNIENNISEKLSYLIYPNPVKDYLTFIFDRDIPEEIVITNSLGQHVMTFSSYSQVDVSHLLPGIYDVSVVGRKKLEAVRFIKQ